ncbi:hypothetical protein [Helicobacter vulpis]|uniref:hypothetical protein n=1 Tax=Helicobacter vulpis TaxID=2316076 RepID=UPI001F2CD400|nr:hypothetical protein [Helicobacter vulpis]
MVVSIFPLSKPRKWLIKWQTRRLGRRLNTRALLFAVLIFSNQSDLEGQLEKLKTYLIQRLPARIAPKVFERVLLHVSNYGLDEALYLRDRARVFELLVQNIQLYALVLDLWDEPLYANQRDILKIAVQNAYDKRYQLDTQSQRALAYQMRQYNPHAVKTL